MNLMFELFKEIYRLYVEMAPYLFFGVLFVGVLNLVVNRDQITRHVGRNDFWSLTKAALFGIPLPLCSCGVIPTAAYMSRNGASSGSTVSFLISTPQTGIDSIFATYGMMGPIYAIYRPIAALFMGVFGGSAVKIFSKDQKPSEKIPQACGIDEKPNKPTFFERVKSSLKYSFVEFLDDIALHFVIGIIIAGLISYLIPEGYFLGTAASSGILGMLIMIVAGAPMYICATASIPLAVSFMSAGFSPGAAFVFLAVGPATNAASFSVLVKTIGKRNSIIYVGSMIVSAIIAGLILDKIFNYIGVTPHEIVKHAHESSILTHEVKLVAAAIFLILILASIYRKYISGKIIGRKKMQSSEFAKMKIEGMTCKHCSATVKKAIESVDGVEEAEIDLDAKTAYIKGDYDEKAVIDAVKAAGYEPQV